MKFKRKTFVKGILAALCACTVLGFSAVYSVSNANKTVANAAVKSNAAYLDLNGSGNILNGFEGAQMESVYLGNYEGSLVKWRVLAKNDTKYGSGNNLLLFSDKSLGSAQYAEVSDSKHAFWGVSKARAHLNGGTYLNAEGTALSSTVSVSLVETLFGAQANYILPAKNSDTHHSVYISALTPKFTTVDGGIRNYFDLNSIGGQSVSASTNTVVENVGGDKLFLLDYCDIANADYGFLEGSNTYTSALGFNNWKWEDGLPSVGDNSKQFHGEGFESSDGALFSMRNTSYISFSGGYHVLAIDGYGTVVSWDLTVQTAMRPAMVLDASKIAYATTTVPESGGFQSLTTSPAKPEYKVYIKNAKYGDYSGNTKGTIKEESGTLNIMYNNPTGISGGKIILLLTKKGATDGGVEYQVALPMSGSATASKKAMASVSLPSGVTLSTHDVTMMYTSSGVGNATEEIYCTYPTDSGIDAPLNIGGEEIVYDGNSKWIDSLGTNTPDWVDLSVYGNTTYMSVAEVEYTDSEEKTTVDTSGSTANIINAGVYKIKLHLAEGLKWSDGTSDDKSFTITVKKKKSSVTAQLKNPPAPTYVPDALPEIECKPGGTEGTIEWDSGQLPQSGKHKYTWTFKPEESKKNNYTEETGSMEFDFAAPAIDKVEITGYTKPADKKLYTTTPQTTLKGWLEVTITYETTAGVTAKTEKTTDFKLEIDTVSGALTEGEVDLYVTVYDEETGKNVRSLNAYTVTVEEMSYVSISTLKLKKTEYKYPVTAEEILKEISAVTVLRNDNTPVDLEDFTIIELAEGTDLTVGESKTITFKIKESEVSKTVSGIKITKGDHDLSVVSFESAEVTHDGKAHSIEYTTSLEGGALPEGVTVKYKYTDKNGKKTEQPTPITFTEVGEYEITLSFINTDANYNDLDATADKTATLTITDKKTYDMSGVTASASGGGIKIVGDYENGITASGTYDGSAVEISLDTSTLPEGLSVKQTTYQKLKEGGDPAKEEDWEEVSGNPEGAGQYRVVIAYKNAKEDYATPEDLEIGLLIAKADVDMTGVEIISTDGGLDSDGNGGFKGTYKPDGNYELDIDRSNLPGNVTAKAPVYKKLKENGNAANPGDWETVTEIKEAGAYKVVVDFEPTDKDNYNGIKSLEATVTISDAVVTGISAKLEDGVKFTAESTLEDLKAKLSAKIEYNNETKEEVKIEDLTITSTGLRVDGKLNAGKQTVTITYRDGDDEFKTTVEIVVEKEKVALPVYNGTLSYTGLEIKPAAEDFTGYNAEIMSFVESKLQGGLNAGTYKAVFALTDTDNYEWATATTLKKVLFAVAVYDGEVTLEANEAAVDWTLSKAKISAKPVEEGALPAFESAGYIGSLNNIVGLKYYKDEACTQEVAAADLANETTYYVKATLLDDTNFELDASAIRYTVAAVSYTTPAGEPTVWDKIVAFLKANWLWLVIALVALILLITIIAVAARAAKKKREREERRLAEEKAERKREQEEREERRREEREERMARMNQQQAMPQMMMPSMMQMPQQMPQMQPQYAPQPQSMSLGGAAADSAQMARIENELAAIRAEQSAAKEIASIKSDAAQQISTAKLEAEVAKLRADMHGVTIPAASTIPNGITLEALTEVIAVALKNAFGDKSQTATVTPESSSSAPATAQVPPDAVMTTVTTTKIDTTKKPVQSTAQAQSNAARPVVRNYVAPMPVDDGRVFDVGGFYKPADPVTDSIDDILGGEDNKN